MLRSNERNRNRRAVAVTNAGYYVLEQSEGKKAGKKMSSLMVMLLGAILTLEIMIAGGMILNIDFYSADRLALVFSFIVMYFAVVAFLADK